MLYVYIIIAIIGTMAIYSQNKLVYKLRLSPRPSTTIFGIVLPKGTGLGIKTHEQSHFKRKPWLYVRLLIQAGWLFPLYYIAVTHNFFCLMLLNTITTIVVIEIDETLSDIAAIRKVGLKKYRIELRGIYKQYGMEKGYKRIANWIYSPIRLILNI